MRRWRKLERGVLRLARREIRASKQIRVERRKARKTAAAWRGQRQSSALWFLFPVAILGAQLIGGDAGLRQKVLLVMTLHLTARTFGIAPALLRSLRGGVPEIHVLLSLPVADRALFDTAYARLVRSAAWSTGVVAILYVLATDPSSPLLVLSASILAVLQGIAMVSGALVLAAFAGRAPLLPVALSFHALSIVAALAPPESALVAGGSQSAASFLPAGAAARAFERGMAGGERSAIFGTIPVLILAALLPVVKERMRRAYTTSSLAPPPGARVARAVVVPVPAAGQPAAVARTAMVSEAGARLRAILDPPTWAGRGRVEAIVERVLSRRERALVELLSGGAPRWGARLRFSILASVAAGVVALYPSEVAASIGAWMLVLPALAVLGVGEWPGLRGAPRNPPPSALYPATHWEISRLVMKVNCAILILWSPCGLAVATELALRGRMDGNVGLAFAGRGLLLVLALQPLVATATTHGNTGFPSPLTLGGIAFVALAAVCLLVLVASVALLTVLGHAVSGAVATSLASLGTWALHGLYVTHGRIDMVGTRA